MNGFTQEIALSDRVKNVGCGTDMNGIHLNVELLAKAFFWPMHYRPEKEWASQSKSAFARAFLA
ncbi:hypothetical protein DS878_02385 [Marinobacter sp. F3R11]|nr:hypothetical protein DS878_02385 [Marinobacter sp. F3R11]